MTSTTNRRLLSPRDLGAGAGFDLAAFTERRIPYTEPTETLVRAFERTIREHDEKAQRWAFGRAVALEAEEKWS